MYRENKRYENRKLRYTVNVEAKVQSLPEIEWKFEDFTVRASHIKRSSVVVQGLVEVEMDQEQRRRYEAAGEDIIADFASLERMARSLPVSGFLNKRRGQGVIIWTAFSFGFPAALGAGEKALPCACKGICQKQMMTLGRACAAAIRKPDSLFMGSLWSFSRFFIKNFPQEKSYVPRISLAI